METRANYVIVGIFTLAAVLAAFGFVYWTSGVGDRGELATLRFRIPGSASGLTRGSVVSFNGIKVGDVTRVYIDVSNPSVAIADAQVDRLHEHRQQSARGGVDEDLGRAVHEGDGQHDPDVRRAGDDEHAQCGEDEHPCGVREHDQTPPVEPVGDRSSVQSEQQPRKELQHGARCDEDGRRGERGDQQGSGGQSDAVTDVARPR